MVLVDNILWYAGLVLPLIVCVSTLAIAHRGTEPLGIYFSGAIVCFILGAGGSYFAGGVILEAMGDGGDVPWDAFTLAWHRMWYPLGIGTVSAVVLAFFALGSSRRSQRWNQEVFLREACNQMAAEVDWDSLDSGRLHHACSVATSNDGERVIVAACDDPKVLAIVLNDAEHERAFESEPSAPLWLYIPTDMDLDESWFVNTVIKRAPFSAA